MGKKLCKRIKKAICDSEKQADARFEMEAWLTEDMNPQTKRYIQERIGKQMVFYKTHSRKYKKNYQFWMTVSICISFLIPVLSVVADITPWMKVIIALLGSGTTAITAYLNMKEYRQLWPVYRHSREHILSILYHYFTQTRIFQKCSDQRERDVKLIETCEAYFLLENKNWQDLFSRDEDEDNKE